MKIDILNKIIKITLLLLLLSPSLPLLLLLFFNHLCHSLSFLKWLHCGQKYPLRQDTVRKIRVLVHCKHPLPVK